MQLIVVDVEADGPVPGLFSMVCFGAVAVEPGLERTFYAQTSPLAGAAWDTEKLASTGFTRSDHLDFQAPHLAMTAFASWLVQFEGPKFISDNPAFDWQFINYYFHRFLTYNPLGHSARRIGDLYCGMEMNMKKNRDWKELRRTAHDHHPLNDAKGNAEALLVMAEMGLKGMFPDDLASLLKAGFCNEGTTASDNEERHK